MSEANHPPDPKFVTVEDAAAYVGLKPITISRLITRGEIPGYKPGRRILRVKLSDLDEWMESHKVEGAEGGESDD